MCATVCLDVGCAIKNGSHQEPFYPRERYAIIERMKTRINRCAGNGAGAEKIARSQIAAAARVMRHHLRGRPVKLSRINLGQDLWLLTLRAHLCGGE